MANALYNTGKQKFLNAEIDMVDDDIRLLLVASTYSVDLNSHENVSDLNPSDIVARSGSLDNKSSTLGVFDADNETVENYGSSGFSYLIIYKNTGDDSTSSLIAYIDTADGLPVPATSGNVSIAVDWSNEVNRIFSL